MTQYRPISDPFSFLQRPIFEAFGDSLGTKPVNQQRPHAMHGGRRQPMCDPEGCSTVWGAVGGGGGTHPPPFVDPNPAERGTESEVAPKWAMWLHNPCSLGGPHRFKAGNFNQKKSRPITTALANAQTGSHQPRSDPEAGSGSKSFFVLFSHF